MLCPSDLSLSTHFLRFVQSSECEWIAVLRVTRGTHQFSLDFLSKWLEISLRAIAHGFESHPLRQKSPVNSRVCWTFLFCTAPQICRFFLLERPVFRVRTACFLVENRVQIRFCYLALLGYIFPAAPEIIWSRKKHSLLHGLRRGYFGSVVEMGIQQLILQPQPM